MKSSCLDERTFLFERNEKLLKIKKDKKQYYENVLECLGKVPVVKLNKIFPEVTRNNTVLLKLEGLNPGGSIKEKNAAYLVDKAEKDGLLRPNGTIIESSSGNFGVGLAIVGAIKGYNVIIVIDAKTTPTFKKLLISYGAKLVEVSADQVDATGSMQKARMKKAKELSLEISNSWYPCQHQNPDNPEAHSIYTAREIEDFCKNGLDAIFVGVSTAGQIMGIANYLRPKYPQVKIFGVDVEGSIIFSNIGHQYKMTGVGLSFNPPNLNKNLIDGAFVINESLSYSICHYLAKNEGLLLGSSSGAILAAALNYLYQNGCQKKIMVISPDKGERYLETIYDENWIRNNFFEIYDHHKIVSKIKDIKGITFQEKDLIYEFNK